MRKVPGIAQTRLHIYFCQIQKKKEKKIIWNRISFQQEWRLVNVGNRFKLWPRNAALVWMRSRNRPNRHSWYNGSQNGKWWKWRKWNKMGSQYINGTEKWSTQRHKPIALQRLKENGSDHHIREGLYERVYIVYRPGCRIFYFMCAGTTFIWHFVRDVAPLPS